MDAQRGQRGGGNAASRSEEVEKKQRDPRKVPLGRISLFKYAPDPEKVSRALFGERKE
jgi:hypothetical protein